MEKERNREREENNKKFVNLEQERNRERESNKKRFDLLENTLRKKEEQLRINTEILQKNEQQKNIKKNAKMMLKTNSFLKLIKSMKIILKIISK